MVPASSGPTSDSWLQFLITVSLYRTPRIAHSHIKEVADASLRRLKTDVIDFFYQHRNETPHLHLRRHAGILGS